MNSQQALAGIWSLGGLPVAALDEIVLSGRDPVFPSSFAVGTAAQTTMAAAALAACELAHARG
ncbi:CoA transferase, partial [Acinetobacter baumannii]